MHSGPFQSAFGRLEKKYMSCPLPRNSAPKSTTSGFLWETEVKLAFFKPLAGLLKPAEAESRCVPLFELQKAFWKVAEYSSSLRQLKGEDFILHKIKY